MSELSRDRLLAELRRNLARAEREGQARSLRVVPGVDFASNDYLGYAAAFRDEGRVASFAGSTGSRLLSGQSEEWAALEEELARWHGGGGSTALYFPSGYVANEGLLSTILRRADWVASDAWNHGSLIDGVRLSKAERFVYPHQDLDALDAALAGVAPERRRFVVTESVFGMDGDLTDLGRLAEICEARDALLIVDEAHGTGCYGPQGQGRVEELGLRDRVLATVHTCGKALGAHGAYVVVPAELRDWLVQSCRHFIFTTALPPGVADFVRRAVDRCRAEPERRERLHANALFVRDGLRAAGLPVPEGARSQIVPVLLGSEARASDWARRLEGRGMRVPAIRFPTVPKGAARLRISVRADHTREELEALVRVLAAW